MVRLAFGGAGGAERRRSPYTVAVSEAALPLTLVCACGGREKGSDGENKELMKKNGINVTSGTNKDVDKLSHNAMAPDFKM